MNSISTKIKIATTIGIATLVGFVLYAKADRTVEDESMDSSYTVRSSPTTDLNAIMKAHPRANEYTSSEYTSKMAPGTTQVSEYLALYEGDKYEDYSYQDETGGYQRKRSPTTRPVAVGDKGDSKIEGQRADQSSSDAYASYGVRSVVVKNDDQEPINEEEDPNLQIETDVKQRVIGVDGYSRDYSKVVRNAETNDDAYQVKETQQSGDSYGGYAVRSVDRTATKATATTDDGYTRKRAPQTIATNAEPVRDNSQSRKTNATYEGYAVRSAGSKSSNPSAASLASTDGYQRRRAPQGTEQSASSLAQYDNAKGNDKAYKSDNTSDNSYGGYAVRSANKKSSTASSDAYGEYNRKRAPQKIATNNAPVKDYANSTKPRNSDSEYGGYAVRSAKGKDVKTAQSTSDDSYGGYAVRSASSKSKSSSRDMATTEGGYARRRAPQISNQSSTNIAQYDNASKNDGAYKTSTSSDDSYGGYAVRSAGKKSTATASTDAYSEYNRKRASQGGSTSSRGYAQGVDNETYGGYAVRSSGKKSTQQPTRTVAQKTSRPRGGVPTSTGLKKYGSRGERLASTASQMDRSVIVMPKRGRSVAGVVIQDDPGRSIIVQSSAGVQSTYRYGEIDALVNL